MNISVDKNEVSKIATSMINNIEYFEDEIKQIQLQIEKLETVWEGSDATKYIDILKNECILELNTFYEIIGEYAEYLKKIPDGYNTLDEIYSSESIE